MTVEERLLLLEQSDQYLKTRISSLEDAVKTLSGAVELNSKTIKAIARIKQS